MPTNPLLEIPDWVRDLLAGRTQDELQAWWQAVCRLYGPEGVRMDFRAVTGVPIALPAWPQPPQAGVGADAPAPL